LPLLKGLAGGVTFWLCLAIAGLAFTNWLTYGWWQNARTEVATEKARVETMVATARKVAADNDAVVAQWKGANAKIKEDSEKQSRALNAKLNSMRGTPVRPDGSAIAVTACPESRVNVVPEKLVPLAEYESLQQRAGEDALQVTLLQDYVTEVCLARSVKNDG
jgi:hypothetical protein